MILMMKRLALPLTAMLVLSACAGFPADAPGAQGETGPRVVAAFYPLEWASSQVLGDLGAVETLTTPGAEAHDLELTPRQIASLADADLVVYLKGFQPAVDNAIKQSGADAVMDVGEIVTLLPADGDHHGHGDAADHDDEGGHSVDDSHDHGTFDPHFWQDPERMSRLIDALADELSGIDPANADAYATAALAAADDLAALDGEFTAGLEQCERREFITTHTSFGYLADRYDLTEIGIAGINPDDEPSPARIAAVHEEAAAHGITTIFFETLTSDAVAKAIAGDLGLDTAVLDPLEGITGHSPGQDYPAVMRANLEALRSANDCA